tara:strand:+ start:873 stop:1076 length:204 start_codon:yes stop_codon:yes gene_type:complete
MANYKRWSNAEKDYIRNNCETYSDKEIAKKMGEIGGENITSDMIRQQRRKMQVIKKKGRPKKKDTIN